MQLGKESLKLFRLAMIRTLISTILVQRPDQLLHLQGNWDSYNKKHSLFHILFILFKTLSFGPAGV